MTTLSPHAAINFLNELIALDRHAVQELLSVRVGCNELMAAHPTLPVDSGSINAAFVRPGEFRFGVLSVLVGLCGMPQMYRNFPIPPFRPVYDNGLLVRVAATDVEAAQRTIDAHYAKMWTPDETVGVSHAG